MTVVCGEYEKIDKYCIVGLHWLTKTRRRCGCWGCPSVWALCPATAGGRAGGSQSSREWRSRPVCGIQLPNPSQRTSCKQILSLNDSGVWPIYWPYCTHFCQLVNSLEAMVDWLREQGCKLLIVENLQTAARWYLADGGRVETAREIARDREKWETIILIFIFTCDDSCSF